MESHLLAKLFLDSCRLRQVTYGATAESISKRSCRVTVLQLWAGRGVLAQSMSTIDFRLIQQASQAHLEGKSMCY